MHSKNPVLKPPKMNLVKGKISIWSRKCVVIFFPGYSGEKRKVDPLSKKMAFGLCAENFGRALVLAEFITEAKRHFNEDNLIRIGIVGGYENEPEIRALRTLRIPLDIEVLGIEEGMVPFDLNVENEGLGEFRNYFDLILCSQVLEHIWNHELAFENLFSLMSTEGYLWLAAPASNRPHGSPEYFSAGFTSDYLARNGERLGLRIISSGQLGSRRNYLATHNLSAWLSVNGHRFPPFFAFSHFRFPLRITMSIRFLLKTFGLFLVSSRVTSNQTFATESWVFLRKP